MMKLEKFKEKTKEFFADNTMSAALDNVLAMFPSTILMPLMVNAAVGIEIFDVSLVLFLSGISTLIFLIITFGHLPGYLGSSFAFIGVTSYIAGLVEGETKEEILSYVIGAYICSGGFLLLLSLLCKVGKNNSNEKVMRIINIIIPTSVMGPAISLIGLELSGQAVTQAGLYQSFNVDTVVALFTVLIIIILSVTRRPFFKKSSILLGVVFAGILAIALNRWDVTPIFKAPILKSPAFVFILPKFSLRIAFMVFPPTLILFCEHIGRKIMVEGLQNGFFQDKVSTIRPQKISLFRSVLGNSIANLVSTGFGGVPLTLYAENLAVMRINNDTRSYQFWVCSIIVIVLSFSGNLLALVESVPNSILGGLSLVLMGIIAAPGIKMLVDDKVDYSKITNLFLTASVLISGLSDMVISVFGTEFKGMSLGLLVGIILNALFKLFSLLTLSKEHLGFDEIVAYCNNLKSILKDESSDVSFRKFDNDTEVEFFVDSKKFIGISNDFDELRITFRTDVPDDECILKFSHKQIDGWLALEVDGAFKDKDLKELIKKSYLLAKEDLTNSQEQINIQEHISSESKIESEEQELQSNTKTDNQEEDSCEGE